MLRLVVFRQGMVAPSPQDCGLSPDRLPADADLKAYLSHPCGVRITGTDTAPAYTYTMAFSMVPITTAYSMAGEPPPSNLRPAAAPLDPNRTDPAQADAPGATRPPLRPLLRRPHHTKTDAPHRLPPTRSVHAHGRVRLPNPLRLHPARQL